MPVDGVPRSPPPPPVPDSNTGFYRGQLSDPRDTAQEKFLIHQSGGGNNNNNAISNNANGNNKDDLELAPDLLKFLKEAGPLQKKVNKVRYVVKASKKSFFVVADSSLTCGSFPFV